jgi:hypothetical protein
MLFSHLSAAEKDGFNIMFFQYLKDIRSLCRIRSVIKGKIKLLLPGPYPEYSPRIKQPDCT